MVVADVGVQMIKPHHKIAAQPRGHAGNAGHAAEAIEVKGF